MFCSVADSVLFVLVMKRAEDSHNKLVAVNVVVIVWAKWLMTIAPR